MATVTQPTPPKKTNPEQAVSYAALILADDSLSITPEKLQTLLRAAGIDDIEPIWTTLFVNALKDKDIKEILTTVAAATGPVGGGAGAAGGGVEGEQGGQDEDEGIDVGGGQDGDGSEDGDGEGMFSLFDE